MSSRSVQPAASPQRRVASRLRAWGAQRYARRHVLALILVLEVLTYWHYVARLTVVNGDTNAHYLSDSYYWWNNGGILNPPEWISYAWMGRPAGSNLQDGSYVIAQGIGNLLGGWTPTTSSITSAVLTGLGAWGMYILVRRLTGSHLAGLLGLIAQFFAPGIFANAQFLDFHRGAAYLPWLLLVASPLWPWRKRWAMPVAALILWQIAVGVYPGQLIVGAYAVAAWVVTWLCRKGEWKGWLWRLALSGMVAVILAAVKLVPALMLGTGEREWEVQRVTLDWQLLGTVFYPYDNAAMTSDIAVRPLFVALPVLLLAGMAAWCSSPAPRCCPGWRGCAHHPGHQGLSFPVGATAGHGLVPFLDQ